MSTERPAELKRYREQLALPLAFADGTPCPPAPRGGLVRSPEEAGALRKASEAAQKLARTPTPAEASRAKGRKSPKPKAPSQGVSFTPPSPRTSRPAALVQVAPAWM